MLNLGFLFAGRLFQASRRSVIRLAVYTFCIQTLEGRVHLIDFKACSRDQDRIDFMVPGVGAAAEFTPIDHFSSKVRERVIIQN